MRNHYRLLAMLGLLLGWLTACAAPVAQTGTTTKPRLVIAIPRAPEILDAQQAYDGDWATMEQIGQALVHIDNATGTLLPDLAKSWAFSEDGKQLTVTLPAGATYSNGDPLDAEALKAAWTRYQTVSPYGVDFEAIVDMTVVDTSTLKATFSNPPASLLPVLASSFGGPWDVAAAQKMGDEAFATAPIASGPLQVKTFTANSEVLMTRNEHYQTAIPFVKNHGPLHVEEVLVRFIPEEATLANELEASAVDVVVGLPASAVERLRSNPELQIAESTLAGYVGLVTNLQRKPFDDLAVRQAIAKALDRDAIVKVLGVAAAPQSVFINKAMIAYSAEIADYAQKLHPYDVAAAKALLTGAGWEDSNGDGIVEKAGVPFAIKFLVSSTAVDQQQVAQVIQAQLKAIGIDVQINQHEPNALNDIMVAGDYDMGFDMIGWRDPDIFSLAFGADFWNFPKYNNPDAAKKLDVARYLLDPAARMAAYAELQKIWLDDVVEIPLWQRKFYVAARNGVKDLVVDPVTGQIFLNDVTVEEQ